MDGYLVRPHRNFFERMSYLSGTANLQSIDFDHKLFVPERFVFGNFGHSEAGFVINPEIWMFYTEDSHELVKYEWRIEEGELDVVREFDLSEAEANGLQDTVRALWKKGEELKQKRRDLMIELKEFGEYFVDYSL